MISCYKLPRTESAGFSFVSFQPLCYYFAGKLVSRSEIPLRGKTLLCLHPRFEKAGFWQSGYNLRTTMKYRPFGKTDFAVSALGFGAMRLPTISDSTRIDEKAAITMIRSAIDGGVNYLDTAYPYHGGQSEILVGKALKNGYRAKVKLATKLPSWLITRKGDFDQYFTEQLQKLQTDRIDFYLLHNLNRDHWPNLCDLDVFSWAEKKRQQGQIGYLGFSFHDSLNLFKEIVDAYPWTFGQIQYNFLDVDYQAGRKGLKYAAKKGLAVVVMEPLKGGKLAGNPPPEVQKIWNSSPVRRPPVDWALQWLWDQPEISTVLSGMSTLEQVRENLQSASKSAPNSLSEEEKRIIQRVQKAYKKLSPIPCTGCKYCLPCPSGVNIPKIFQIYNEVITFGGLVSAQKAYAGLTNAEKTINCTRCGQCERKCPQKIAIRKWLVDCGQYLS